MGEPIHHRGMGDVRDHCDILDSRLPTDPETMVGVDDKQGTGPRRTGREIDAMSILKRRKEVAKKMAEEYKRTGTFAPTETVRQVLYRMLEEWESQVRGVDGLPRIAEIDAFLDKCEDRVRTALASSPATTPPRAEQDPPARETSPPDSPSKPPRYGDWRDEIAATYPTSGPIPEHPWAEFGLWYDSGVRTADDALRCAISSAEAMGFAVEPEYRELVDADGWTDPETTDPEILHDIEQDATNYINAVLSAYGVEGWVGWDGDIGGFGLWEYDPED